MYNHEKSDANVQKMSTPLDPSAAPPARRRRYLAAAMTLALSAPLAACDSQQGESSRRPDVAPVISTQITGPDGRSWLKLSADGLHDPDNELLAYLQEPAEALSGLTKGGVNGNQVDWVESLRAGLIEPRTNIRPETNIRVLDLDIVFPDTAGQPMVVFPHRQHTAWLDCANCHPGVFIAKKGANKFGMLDVLRGEYCGRCHGAVAFPLTECKRCHSRDRPKGGAQ